MRSPHPARVGVCAALLLAAMLLALSARAGSDDPNINSLSVDQCRQKSYEGAASIYSNAERRVLKTDFDPEANCKKNAGSELLSHNATAVEAAPEIMRFRNSLGLGDRGPDFYKQLGACRLSYQGIKEVFDTFAALREVYCEKLGAALQEAKNCGSGTPEKKCAKEWENYRDVHKTYANAISNRVSLSRPYLAGLIKVANRAREKYEEDLRKLEPALNRRDLSHLSAADLSDKVPDVKPSNGNLATHESNSLKDYFELLRGPEIRVPTSRVTQARDLSPRRGDLIVEEVAAAQKLKQFDEVAWKLLDSQRETAANSADWVTKQLEQAEHNTSTNGAVSTLNKYGPAISTMAGPVQQLLGPKGEPSALAAPVISGASHAPIAEVAAVAGLSALAARSFSGASSSGGGTSASPALPSAAAPGAGGAPEVNKFNDRASGRGDGDKGTNVAQPGKGDGKTDTGKGDGEGAVLSHSFGGSEGSSRMISAKKQAAAAPAAAAAVDAGGAGMNNDALGNNFGQNLDPRPAPKAAAPNPGSEVANLLGQMKNLFNFDEQNPGGGMPGAPGAGGMPGAPGADMGASTMPGAEGDPAAMAAGEAPPPEAGAEAAAAGEPGAAEEPRAASLFGKADTSLFARVRARHHRCMERGLVLYDLGERVE